MHRAFRFDKGIARRRRFRHESRLSEAPNGAQRRHERNYILLHACFATPRRRRRSQFGEHSRPALQSVARAPIEAQGLAGEGMSISTDGLWVVEYYIA